MKKEKFATLGLLLITLWSAMQYVFLTNVPDTVSTFSFLCITNGIGLLVFGLTQVKKLKRINRKTLLKGALFAVELSGFNFFLVIGSRNMDSVVVSGLISMYFVFVIPILLILKKKISFRSLIATTIAVIALALMFEANLDKILQSANVIYLIIADVFFAAYVVSVSELGKNEDSAVLTMSQMFFAAIIAAIGWAVEASIGNYGFTIPTEGSFWISAIFIGICIRALYSFLQISCQKYVPPINASLIFSSEIIMTLILNPLLCSIFKTEYTPATVYQVIGCVLFVVSVLVVDDTIMHKFGYSDMENVNYINEKGEQITGSSVSRKMINMTLVISMSALVVSTIVCLAAIQNIRKTTVRDSTNLGHDAAKISEDALLQELEKEISQTARDKTRIAGEKLSAYTNSAVYAASYAETLYRDPQNFSNKEVMYPEEVNFGKWVMQRCIADRSISYDSLQKENLLLGNMVDVFDPIIKHNDNVATIYIGTETGLLVSYDTYSQTDNPGGDIYYEFRESEWYKLGKVKGECAFTGSYQDSYDRGLTITCVMPFYDRYGSFAGCIAMDILMEDMNESIVNDDINEPNYAVLIDEKGNMIAGKDVDPHSGDSHPYPMADQVLSRREGVVSTEDEGGAVYIAYSTIDFTGWKLCIISPVETIIAPVVSIKENIDRNTEQVTESVTRGIRTMVENCLVLFTVILLAITYFIGKASEKISKPIKTLEKDVKEISGGNFDQRTLVNTNDEIGSLARAINFMTQSLQQYMGDLKEATAKEERVASELSLAADIQTSILPTNFRTFTDHREFELHAIMDPAKEVGGDFYDFFMVDDIHLAVVIADVSGKGVPAALFMVIGKTLIKDNTQAGVPLGEVFTKVNHLLCEANREGFFITAFEGILNLETGELEYANAGHEPPFICRKGGQFEVQKLPAGFVLAGMDGMTYKEGFLQLNPGDRIFLYTDGANEAINSDEKMFDMERLGEALNSNRDMAPEELLVAVKREIDTFVGEADQFDDITMLCLDFVEMKKRSVNELRISAKLENLGQVLNYIESILVEGGVSKKVSMEVLIAAEEVFVNIATYAYGEQTGEAVIQVDVTKGGKIMLTFIDNGIPYNPLEKPDPDTTLAIENREIGGLGIFMVKESMDKVTYRYEDGQNQLIVEKSFLI